MFIPYHRSKTQAVTCNVISRRKMSPVSASNWKPSSDELQCTRCRVGASGFHVVNGLKMSSSQASICRAHNHYQTHSMLHYLPSGHRHDSRVLLSDAGDSRWEVEVVNVHLPLTPSGHSGPFSLFVVSPSSTLRRPESFEA